MERQPPSLTVLHIAPHPDDEALGACATLLALRAAGHRVVNLCCSLGRTPQHARRRSEVQEACRRAGFELRVPDPPVDLSGDDDLPRARQRTARLLSELVTTLGPDLVVGPSPHDGHHGHEAVGRAVIDALAGTPRRLWLWGLWSDLPLPTLCVPFDSQRLAACQRVLAAHEGELARNAFAELLGARARAARVLAAERVFGFGTAAVCEPYAEALCELEWDAGEWWAGAPRRLDARGALAPVPRDRPLGWWLSEPSFAERLRRSPPN